MFKFFSVFTFSVLHPLGHRALWISSCKHSQKCLKIFCFQCHFLLSLPTHPQHLIGSLSNMYENMHKVSWDSPWTKDTQWTRRALCPLASLMCGSLIYHLSQWWFHNAGLTPVRPMGILPSILLGERHELLQTSWEVFWECLLNYTHAPWWLDILLEIHLTNIYNLEILKVHECHNFSFLLHYFSLCFWPFLHSFPPFDHSYIPESPCHPQHIHFA